MEFSVYREGGSHRYGSNVLKRRRISFPGAVCIGDRTAFRNTGVPKTKRAVPVDVGPARNSHVRVVLYARSWAEGWTWVDEGARVDKT